MWSVTSSSNTFDPTQILECFLKYRSKKNLILDHQENSNFIPLILFMSSQEALEGKPKKKFFEDQHKVVSFLKLENVP